MSKYLDISLAGKKIKDTRDKIENAFELVEKDINEKNEKNDDLQYQITINENDIENKLQAHKESTDHPAENITYTGKVAGQTNVKEAVDNLQEQANAIVVGGTESDPRVSQALVDSENETHGTLKARNNKWEGRIKMHEQSSMPHLIIDEDTGRKYRWGRRFKDGGMQKFWEEVK